MMITALVASAMLSPAAPLPDDYRRLECHFDGSSAAFLLDMPTAAFLRRYRGDIARLFSISTEADSTLDGVRFSKVENDWPETLDAEWTGANTSVNRLVLGPLDAVTGTAPFTLSWDSTPSYARMNWIESRGICNLIEGEVA